MNRSQTLRTAAKTLEESFPNGLELGSKEARRFAVMFASRVGNPKLAETIDDEKLEKLFRSVGVIIDGRAYPNFGSLQNVVLSKETTKYLFYVITKFFPEGINIESSAQLKKFWEAVSSVGEKKKKEFEALLDEFLRIKRKVKTCLQADYVILNRMLVKIMLPFKGYLYPVLKSTLKLVEDAADQIFDDGAKIIYYSVFFERYKDWLVGKQIVSAEFFSYWLLRVESKFVRGKFYFERYENDASEEEKVCEEIERIVERVGNDVPKERTFQVLVARSFVPEEILRNTIKSSPGLKWILESYEEQQKTKESFPPIKWRKEEEIKDVEEEENVDEEQEIDEEESVDEESEIDKEESVDEESEVEEEEFEEEQEVEDSPKVDEKESTAPSNPNPPLDLRVALIQTLIERFPNGFPLDSKLELKKLRRYTGEIFANVDDYVDDRIRMILRREGCLFNNRIYILEDDADAAIQRKIEEAFASGADVVYFEPLFQTLRDELPDFFSVELLKSRVKTTLAGLCTVEPEFCERRRFVGFQLNASTKNIEEGKIAKEIKRVWGDGTVLSSDELVERLPLVPPEKINAVLKRGSDFERNVKDTYVRLDQIIVEEEDRRVAKEHVAREVGLNDYASLENMPVGNMSLRYEEVELNCLQRILFKDCLDAKYELRGRVVTLKGLGYTAKDLIKKMCRNESRVSIEQLIAWEQDLTGKSTYVYALSAAYETMIRTSQEEFVDDKSVSFDVEEIDKKIDELMGEQEYLPLSAFVSFTTYPNPGVAWSKFLLESFCQPRFSRKFVLLNTIPNSSNVGVVLRKESAMDYDEIIEDAVLSSDVPLTKESVLNFLTTYGYIGQKRYSKIEELLKKAKIARLEKENR